MNRYIQGGYHPVVSVVYGRDVLQKLVFPAGGAALGVLVDHLNSLGEEDSIFACSHFGQSGWSRAVQIVKVCLV